jgi:hypothetical protein
LPRGADTPGRGLGLAPFAPPAQSTGIAKGRSANDRLARLKARQKKAEVRQQIVIGAAVLAVAKVSPADARALLDLLGKAKLREAEARDIAPVIEDLRQLAGVVEPPRADRSQSGG